MGEPCKRWKVEGHELKGGRGQWYSGMVDRGGVGEEDATAKKRGTGCNYMSPRHRSCYIPIVYLK